HPYLHGRGQYREAGKSRPHTPVQASTNDPDRCNTQSPPGHRWRWTVMASLPVTAQTAGKGAARAAARRRGTPASRAASRRPGWVTYLLLGFALVISIFPLYYTLVLGSSTQEEIAQHAVPQWLPDLSLFDRFATVIGSSQINFGKALLNSVI